MEEPPDSALRQQFQALQEQQKKKLMKRKQKKEDKQKDETSKETKVNGLGISDNMDLQLSEPIPQDSIFNEELNNHLQEQLRELKDETGRLYKLLSERDHEVRKLKKKCEEEKQAFSGMGGGMATDVAATKIVELSKKNRELTAELESEKTKLKQLILKLREAEKNSSKATSSRSPRAPTDEYKDPLEIQADKTAAELKSTQEKLNQATSKLGEFRTQVATLKQDLKIAHKALSNEVGEGVNVSALLSGTNSNWRGRAQQIIILQKKVSDLKSQLEEVQQLRPATEMSLEDQFMNMEVGEEGASTARTSASLRSTRTGGGGGGTRIDEVQKNRIKQMEKERREAKEKAQTELHLMEEDYKRMKEKMEAVKARNKVLSNNLKSCKQQMTVLTDKGRHDNELIEALMKQQSHLKNLLDQKTAGFEEDKMKQEQSKLEMQLSNQKNANVVEQLKRIVAEKEEKVKHLEEEILAMQQNRVTSMDNPHVLPPQPPRSSMSSTTPPSRQAVYSSSRQRTPSRQSRENTPVLNRVTSQRGMRPASTGSMSVVATATEPSDEVRRQFQEYKSLLQVAQVERDRVMELIKVLQLRCDESNQRVTEMQAQVSEMKQRNAHLEKQLDRLKVENSKGSAKKSSKIQVDSLTSIEDLLKEDLFVSKETTEELQTRLAIQIDENNALKNALQSTLKSKDEDLKLYQQMMEQTKQVFLTGLRQYRQTST